MQHAPATNDIVFDDYIGGEIVVTTLSNGLSLIRGTLLSVDVKDEWISVRLTCREYAIGDPDLDTDPVWYQSSDQPTAVLLKAPAHITEEGTLAFTEATPQGTTAVVSLSEQIQSSEAA